MALLEFRSCALGAMEVTLPTHPKNREGSITILGEHRAVVIDGTAVNRVAHWQLPEHDDDDKRIARAATSPPNVCDFEAFERNVVAVLRGEARPDTDARSGRKIARDHPQARTNRRRLAGKWGCRCAGKYERLRDRGHRCRVEFVERLVQSLAGAFRACGKGGGASAGPV